MMLVTVKRENTQCTETVSTSELLQSRERTANACPRCQGAHTLHKSGLQDTSGNQLVQHPTPKVPVVVEVKAAAAGNTNRHQGASWRVCLHRPQEQTTRCASISVCTYSFSICGSHFICHASFIRFVCGLDCSSLYQNVQSFTCNNPPLN